MGIPSQIISATPVVDQAAGFLEVAKKVSNCTSPVEVLKQLLVKYPLKCLLMFTFK